MLGLWGKSFSSWGWLLSVGQVMERERIGFGLGTCSCEGSMGDGSLIVSQRWEACATSQ